MPGSLRTGADVRDARRRLGLTLEQTALLLDVAVITLSRWERGVVEPSLLVLRGIEGMFSDYRKSTKKRM